MKFSVPLHLDWYHQLLNAAREQGCNLLLTADVSWVNVPQKLQAQIQGGQKA